MRNFRCRCGKRIELPDTYEGRWTNCPQCGQRALAESLRMPSLRQRLHRRSQWNNVARSAGRPWKQRMSGTPLLFAAACSSPMRSAWQTAQRTRRSPSGLTRRASPSENVRSATATRQSGHRLLTNRALRKLGPEVPVPKGDTRPYCGQFERDKFGISFIGLDAPCSLIRDGVQKDECPPSRVSPFAFRSKGSPLNDSATSAYTRLASEQASTITQPDGNRQPGGRPSNGIAAGQQCEKCCTHSGWA